MVSIALKNTEVPEGWLALSGNYIKEGTAVTLTESLHQCSKICVLSIDSCAPGMWKHALGSLKTMLSRPSYSLSRFPT